MHLGAERCELASLSKILARDCPFICNNNSPYNMTKNEYASARIAEEESDVEAQTNAASTTAAESGEEFPMVNEGGEDEQLIQPPKEIDIPISKKIFTDKQLYSMSLWAIRISVLTDSINNTVSANNLLE